MTRRPPKACLEPGCPNVGPNARCDVHTRVVASEVDARRGSAASRGYGPQWRAIRKRHLELNPLCVVCLAVGFVVAATDVDHIVPFRIVLKHEDSNLQSLCHSHHSQKTAREDGAFGRRPR